MKQLIFIIMSLMLLLQISCQSAWNPWLVSRPQCGVLDLVCCDNQICNDGSACVSGLCLSCGGNGKACCLERTCDANDICTGDGDGICTRCGEASAPCCNGNKCNNDGCCMNNICVGAGSLCPGNGKICSQSSCGDCGGRGQRCCGTICTAEGTSCQDGVCAACGDINMPCCAASACSGKRQTLACNDNKCLLCGYLDEPCCPGQICTTCTRGSQDMDDGGLMTGTCRLFGPPWSCTNGKCVD